MENGYSILHNLSTMHIIGEMVRKPLRQSGSYHKASSILEKEVPILTLHPLTALYTTCD